MTDISTTLIEVEIEPQNIFVEINPMQLVNYEVSNAGSSTGNYISGATVSAYLCVSNSNTGFIPTSADNLNTAWNILGILTSDSVTGSENVVQYQGELVNVNWNWQLDLPIYVGINGLLTQFPSELASFMCEVARPITSTIININIQEIILL
jgi:hypothetical protein